MKLTKLNELIEDGKVIKGDWELTPNHEVRYRGKDKNEELRVKGALIAAEPGVLVLSLTEKQSDQKIVTSIVKLTGTWKLNSQNQIVFEVEKERSKNDVLVFRNAWQVNGSNEIIYTYEENQLKKKKKILRELAFRGHWDLSERNRLTYFLGGDTDSAFRLRGTFQTRSILAKRNEIRYQAGVEVSGKHRIQGIRIFGKWKVTHDLDLSFEVEYAGGRKRAMVFEGEYALDPSHRVIARLKNQEGDPLGVELILTKDIFQRDGEAFVRLQKSLKESSVEAGIRARW